VFVAGLLQVVVWRIAAGLLRAVVWHIVAPHIGARGIGADTILIEERRLEPRR
jgi:hypothetical protein